MPGESKLTAKIETIGGKEAAEQLRNVSNAQKGITSESASSKEQIEQTDQAQQGLNQTSSDYLAFLTLVSPRLSRFGIAFRSLGLAAVAKLNTSVTQTFKNMTAAVKNNAGILKTIGAGGLVVGAILAISNAISKIREEFDEATVSIQKNIDAQNELKGKEADRKQAIEALADQRAQGGFSADEARIAARKAGQISAASPFLDEAAVNQAVAFGGEQKSVDQLSRIAFLIQSQRLDLSPGQSEANRESRIENAINRFSGIIDQTFSRERIQVAETIQGAQQQRRQAGGATTDLESIIDRFTKGTGIDSSNVAKLVQVIEDEMQNGPFTRQGIAFKEKKKFLFALRNQGLRLSGNEKPSDQAIEVAKQVFTFLQNQERTGATTIVINNQGSRNVIPDATARRRREQNGQNIALRKGFR